MEEDPLLAHALAWINRASYGGQALTNLLVLIYGHHNEATLQLAKLYPPVQFIPIIFALVLIAAS